MRSNANVFARHGKAEGIWTNWNRQQANNKIIRTAGLPRAVAWGDKSHVQIVSLRLKER
jgi:hypothetical protein